MYHNIVEDLATKIVESKSYSFEMELKLLRLEKHLEEQKHTHIEDEQQYITTHSTFHADSRC